MTEIVVIAIAAFAASMLTFFSGFGLGTILTPVFILFVPVEMAIAMTGVVHFLNNIFKFGLIGRQAIVSVVVRFGIPAIAGALAGALILTRLSDISQSLLEYSIAGRVMTITPVKLVISILMILFGIMEILPFLKKLQFNKKFLIPGGVLSGFFGGLSGHQGALRTAFLIRLGLSKEAFIATGITISLLIDLTRIPVYYNHLAKDFMNIDITPVIIATASAFAGALLGRQLLKKITLGFVHLIVGIAIIALAVCLGLGLI